MTPRNETCITNTKAIVGITIALTFPFFTKPRGQLPTGWNFDDLAIQNLDDKLSELGVDYELYTGGLQDSAFLTLKYKPEEYTWDDLISECTLAWEDTPTDHPVRHCHVCGCYTQWEFVTFHTRCTVCGEWDGGESEDYLAEIDGQDYWMDSAGVKADRLEWETFGPQKTETGETNL